MSMSLSPRPDNVTTIESDFDLVLAILIACETACADSSAGMIPSVLVSVKKALMASLSVALLYFTLPVSFKNACSGPTPG